jgi:hypothetical protein
MTFLVVAETFVPSGSPPGPLYFARGLRKRLRWTLPEEFVTELSGPQDDMAPVPGPEIDQVIRAELGAGVDELFACFERTPVAAASIAQVHAGNPQVGPAGGGQGLPARVVESDLGILERLALRLQRSTRWGWAAGAVDLAHGFGDALREELDLPVEERNMTSAAAAALRGGTGVRIPVPVGPMPTRRVLVMERLDGQPLSTIKPGMLSADRNALARSLLDCLLREVMVDGSSTPIRIRATSSCCATGSWACWTSARSGVSTPGCERLCSGCCSPSTTVTRRRSPMRCFEIVERPEDLDEDQLHRSLGRFLARHAHARPPQRTPRDQQHHPSTSSSAAAPRHRRGSRPPHAGRGPAAGNNLSEIPKESQMESHALPDALGRVRTPADQWLEPPAQHAPHPSDEEIR